MQSLGGKFQEHLDPTTTHLVVKQTGSAKFKVVVFSIKWVNLFKIRLRWSGV